MSSSTLFGRVDGRTRGGKAEFRPFRETSGENEPLVGANDSGGLTDEIAAVVRRTGGSFCAPAGAPAAASRVDSRVVAGPSLIGASLFAEALSSASTFEHDEQVAVPSFAN